MLSSAIEVSSRGILGAVVVSLALIVYQVADPPITTLGYCEERGRWLNVKGRYLPPTCRCKFRLMSSIRASFVHRTSPNSKTHKDIQLCAFSLCL